MRERLDTGHLGVVQVLKEDDACPLADEEPNKVFTCLLTDFIFPPMPRGKGELVFAGLIGM